MNSEAGINSGAHQGEGISCGIKCESRGKGCGIDSQQTVRLKSILVPHKGKGIICGVNGGISWKGCRIDSLQTVRLDSILVPTKEGEIIVELIVGAVGRTWN